MDINEKTLKKIWGILSDIQSCRELGLSTSANNETLTADFEVTSEVDALLSLLTENSVIDNLQKEVIVLNTGVESSEILRCEFSINEEEYNNFVKKIENMLENGSSLSIVFDLASHTLFIGDKEIIFQIRNAGSNEVDLCRAVLKNKTSINKSWEILDVLEEWDSEYANHCKVTEAEKMKVYHSARSVNEKIEKESAGKIKKFFIINTKIIAVNPLYRNLISFNKS